MTGRRRRRAHPLRRQARPGAVDIPVRAWRLPNRQSTGSRRLRPPGASVCDVPSRATDRDRSREDRRRGGACWSGAVYVGRGEVVAFEKQRRIVRLGRCIGQAIAEIELRGVAAAFAVPRESNLGRAGDLGAVSQPLERHRVESAVHVPCVASLVFLPKMATSADENHLRHRLLPASTCRPRDFSISAAIQPVQTSGFTPDHQRHAVAAYRQARARVRQRAGCGSITCPCIYTSACVKTSSLDVSTVCRPEP